MQNSSYESLDSTGQNDQESCGTVVRTPHQRSLVDVSRAALELFENGISFDPSFRSKRAGHGSSSDHESSGGVSPTSKVPPGPERKTDSKSQAFLGKYQNSTEDTGGELKKPGHRTVTRKAFRELTNSLRTKKSLSNILMTNTQTRIQSMAKKHILRRVNTSSPMVSPTEGTWAEEVDQQTEPVKTTPPSLPSIKHQGPLQVEDNVESILILDRIRQDMTMLRNGLLDLEPVQAGKENKQGHNISAQGRTGMLSSTTGVEVVDESACTPITITTGSLRLRSGPSKDFDALAAKKQEKPTASCPEKKSSVSPKTEDTPAATPSDTTFLVPADQQQDEKQYVLKTTRAANRLQLRQKKADMVTQSTESKPSTANQSQTEVQPTPKVMLKIAYAEERKKKRKAEEAVLTVLALQTRTKRHICGVCSECLHVGLPCHLTWKTKLS